MLIDKINEINALGKLDTLKGYLRNVGANLKYAKAGYSFSESGWYCVLDADGYDRFLVYHYDIGKKLTLRCIDGKTPCVQECYPNIYLGEIADVFSIMAFATDESGNIIDIVQDALDDETLKINKLNTEEGDAVKLVGYDSEGNLVEDEIPEGIVVDDALNTESDNAIANAPVATALNEKADTSDLLDGTLIPNKALQAKSIEAVSTESGAVQDTPFIYQGTGTANGTSIADTSPVGKHLEKQGNSVVVNQLVKNPDFSANTDWVSANSNYGNTVIADGKATWTCTANVENYAFWAGILSGEYMSIPSGHKVLAIAKVKPSIDCKITIWGMISNANTYFYRTEDDVPANQWSLVTGFIADRPANTTITRAKVSMDTDLANLVTGVTLEVDYCYFIDFTQWFNGDIPQDLLDHPENFFRYYNGSLAYNAGTLENADGRYLECGGRNVWDGTHDFNAIPNATYYCYGTSVIITYKDADGNTISTDTKTNETFVAPSNCLTIGISGSGDICISIYYETGDSYDQYFPYEEPKVYDTGSEVLRRAGSVRDVKLPNGTITRKVGVVDLGTLNYVKGSNNRYYTEGVVSLIKPSSSDNVKGNLTCSRFTNSTQNDVYANTQENSVCVNSTGVVYFYVDATYYSNNDATAFKTAMSGVYLYYEFAEPTTEQGTPFTENIEINDYGTMAWDSEVPQGCKIFYPADYALFIDSLGEKFNWDVDDIASKNEITDSALAERGYQKVVDLSDGITNVAGLTEDFLKAYKVGNMVCISAKLKNETGSSIASGTDLLTLASGLYTNATYHRFACVVGTTLAFVSLLGDGKIQCNSAIPAGDSLFLEAYYAVA